MGHTVVHHTNVHHHGERITIFGVPRAGLLAVTAYGTRRQKLLGLITVHPRPGGAVYRLFGLGPDLTDVDAAAELLSRRCDGF